MDAPEGDRAAIVAARSGDGDAFGLLVQRYQEAAFRTAWLIVRDSAAAEDVAQEAFVRAYRGLGRFRESEPFRPWLLRIVTNMALNETRSSGRQLRFLERFGRQPSETPPRPDEVAVMNDQHRQLWEAISGLREEDRVVLYLRYFAGLPEAEIAAVIGRPPGTVKSRLHRAGARLRAVIEERYPGLRPVGAGGEGHA